MKWGVILNLVSTPVATMCYPWLLRGKQAALFHFTGSPGAAGIVTGRTKETRAVGLLLTQDLGEILQCTRDLNMEEYAKGH